MTKYVITLLFIIFTGKLSVFSQVAADCVNAVPICNNTPINGGTNGFGIDDFNGATVSGCIAQSTGTIETNSAWYRFRTRESGQLGFNIGFDSNEDWDFALYKIDDCSNLGEPIRCNYFDNSDSSSYTGVGEDPTGLVNIQYDDWLDVSANEDYYLLINNFSNNNSGFSIQFSGTIFVEFPSAALDCSIIDNLLGPPIISCGNDEVTLDATTLGAIGYEWYLDSGTGYQQILGENGPQLSVAISAMYRVLVISSSGNNTISETQVAFVTSPITNPLIDEAVCLNGGAIDLSRKDSEALGNQNAIEFQVSYHATMQEAVAGSDALPKEYIPTMPAQTIYVRTTSSENANCFDVSESFEINGIEPPSLNFETEVLVCGDAPVATIGEPVQDPNFSYVWNTGETTSQITVAQEGIYTLSVTDALGVVPCASVRSIAVVFSLPPVISDVIIDYGNDVGNRVEVQLEKEGDFEYRLDDKAPQHDSVFADILPGEHTISVTDLNGCGFDNTEIVVLGFPKFFTPNADGTNDTWHIEGLSVLENPLVTIYDRYGKLLYQLNGSSMGWDGTFNGALLPEADYWFKLSYSNSEGQTINASYINNHFSLKR